MAARPHITEEEFHLFNDSFERCLRSGTFFDEFYDRLRTSYPDIEVLFAGTDMASHKRKLRAALYLCLSAAWDDAQAHRQLVRLGKYHRSQGIERSYYALWLESIIGAARACDTVFMAPTERAWRRVLEPGIEAMREAA